jgi:hypothetical protein
MRRNNEQTTKIYTTLDSYQAGFLSLKGHIPELREQNGKVIFVFTHSDALLKSLLDYNNGAMVEASRFAFSIKALKSQIHSMRRDKDYGIDYDHRSE